MVAAVVDPAVEDDLGADLSLGELSTAVRPLEVGDETGYEGPLRLR